MGAPYVQGMVFYQFAPAKAGQHPAIRYRQRKAQGRRGFRRGFRHRRWDRRGSGFFGRGRRFGRFGVALGLLFYNVIVIPLVALLLPGGNGWFGLLFADAVNGVLGGKPGGSARPGNAQRQGNVKTLGFHKRPDSVISVHIQPSFALSGG